MTIIEAIADRTLFASAFRDPATWQAWRVFLVALFGLPMTPEQFALFRQCTSRATAPQRPVIEAWLVCGRRAGKSFVLALIAVFLACFRDGVRTSGRASARQSWSSPPIASKRG